MKMELIKKTTAILFSSVMCLYIAGCGLNVEETKTPEAEKTPEVKTLAIQDLKTDETLCVPLGDTLTFTVEDAFEAFDTLIVDDKEVSAANYFVAQTPVSEDGLIVVHIKGQHINELGIGEHSAIVKTKNGESEKVPFSIIEKTKEDLTKKEEPEEDEAEEETKAQKASSTVSTATAASAPNSIHEYPYEDYTTDRNSIKKYDREDWQWNLGYNPDYFHAFSWKCYYCGYENQNNRTILHRPTQKFVDDPKCEKCGRLYSETEGWRCCLCLEVNHDVDNCEKCGAPKGVTQKDVADQKKQITLSLISGLSTQKEQYKAIASWIMDHIDYNYTNYKDDFVMDSFLVEGTYIKKYGVCMDYTDLVLEMCSYANIKAEFIDGVADSGSYGTGGHAWNKVCLDGTWYYSDITWADTTGRKLNSEYYLSESLWENHRENGTFRKNY